MSWTVTKPQQNDVYTLGPLLHEGGGHKDDVLVW